MMMGEKYAVLLPAAHKTKTGNRRIRGFPSLHIMIVFPVLFLFRCREEKSCCAG